MMKAIRARIATEIGSLFSMTKTATDFKAPMITLHMVVKERTGLLKTDTFEKSCFSSLLLEAFELRLVSAWVDSVPLSSVSRG